MLKQDELDQITEQIVDQKIFSARLCVWKMKTIQCH